VDEPTNVFEECSGCGTLFKFPATANQASRYYPPRTEPVQNIFPELPVVACAVLTQGNRCGLCINPNYENVRQLLKPYIVDDTENDDQ
jgi:hypothetical protein